MKQDKKIHYGWIVAFTGFLALIGAHGFGRMSYTLILPAMKDGLKFSYTQLGLLETGNFIGYLFMAIIGGMLAAKFGARKVISIALFSMSITLACMGLAHSFGFAFSMRAITGIGNGAAYVPAMALGAAWFAPKYRGVATGIVTGGIGGGAMLSGLLVPSIINHFQMDGWRYAWYFLGASVFFIAIVTAVLLRDVPSDIDLLPIGQENSDGISSQIKKSTTIEWGKVYKEKKVWHLAIVYFMYGISYIIYITFFVVYLMKEQGFSGAQAGGLWALVGGLSTLCGLIWGGISDKIGRAKAMSLAYTVLGLTYLLYAVTPVKAGLYVSAVIFGLSAWSIPTITAAASGDYVGPRLAPACLGFITLFFGIGQAIGPLLGGLIADHTHSFKLAFATAFAFSIIGAILSLGLRTYETARQN
jgi:MFS family permease